MKEVRAARGRAGGGPEPVRESLSPMSPTRSPGRGGEGGRTSEARGAARDGAVGRPRPTPHPSSWKCPVQATDGYGPGGNRRRHRSRSRDRDTFPSLPRLTSPGRHTFPACSASAPLPTRPSSPSTAQPPQTPPFCQIPAREKGKTAGCAGFGQSRQTGTDRWARRRTNPAATVGPLGRRRTERRRPPREGRRLPGYPARGRPRITAQPR